MTQTPPESSPPPSRSQGSVEHMMRRGMFWNAVSFVASQGSGFLIFLILAIRLPPEIFGVVALASILAEFVATDGRYACMDAIVQAGRFDRRSLNSFFWAFFGISALVAVAMTASAPLVASHSDTALVATFMPVFGLMLLPVPWLGVMDALIMRELGFRQFAQRNILGTVVGGVAGIAVAFSPWIIWALPIQRLVTLLVTTLFEYRYTRWMPGFDVSREATLDFLKRLFPLWIINSLNQLVTRIVIIVFGIRYDAHTVGLLRAANRITETVQQPIVSPMMGLWFPLMAKVKGDIASERSVYRNIVWTTAAFCLPAFAGLAIVADDLVSVLLPQQFYDSAPMISASSILCILIPVSWFNAIAMTSLGMNKTSLYLTLASVTGCLVTVFSFPGLAAAETLLTLAVPSLAVGIIGNVIVDRRLKQSSWGHYAGLAPAVFATVAMSAACWGLHRAAEGADPLVRLIACVTVGVVVYVGWLLTFHRSWFLQRIDLFRGKTASPGLAPA